MIKSNMIKSKKFKFKKSEIEMKTLVTAIIIMIIIVLLMYVIFKLYADAKLNLEVKQCRNSIMAHDFLSTSTLRTVFTDIKCPTRHITFSTFGANKDDEIKNVIAADMQRCWYEWGSGKGEYFSGDGTFCHICAIYDFKEKDRKIQGFMRYLTSEKIHPRYSGETSGLTYYQYFLPTYKNAPPQELVNQMKQVGLADADSIDTSQKYATIFVYSSNKEAIQKILEGGMRPAVFAGGGLMLNLGTAGTVGGIGTIILLGSNPVGWFITTAGAVSIAAGTVATYFATDVRAPKTVNLITFKPYTKDEIEGIPCQRLEVNQLSHQEP